MQRSFRIGRLLIYSLRLLLLLVIRVVRNEERLLHKDITCEHATHDDDDDDDDDDDHDGDFRSK